MSTQTWKPASDKQLGLINRLLSEKQIDREDIDTIDRDIEMGLSSRGASTWIDFLFTRKRLPAQQALAVDVPARPRPTVPGFYKNDNDFVFKVVLTKDGERLYAKQTTVSGLVYIPGAMGTLFADQKMTGEEIAAHGVANNYCVNCSHELEDPTSKHIGLGTSCGPAILGKDGYKAAKLAVAGQPDVAAFEAAKKAKAKEAREAKKAEEAQLVLI